MCHRHLVALAASVVLLIGGATQRQAQNLVINGDFETPVVPDVGDNMITLPPPWFSPYPTSIVRVEGPNGAVPTAAPGFPIGDAVLQALPRSDASITPAGQYIRPFFAIV